MKKYLMIFVCLPFLFIIGCTEDDLEEKSSATVQFEKINKKLDDVNEQLSQYESKLADNEKTINEFQELLESTTNADSERLKQLENYVYINQQLLNQLPDITVKQGFIKEVIEVENEKSVIIDYAHWQPTPDAPNDGVLVNEKEENDKVKVHEDTSVFILDGVTLGNQTFEDFILSEHRGVYNLYFIENRIVLITEKYFP